jgi:hypothetical protein
VEAGLAGRSGAARRWALRSRHRAAKLSVSPNSSGVVGRPRRWAGGEEAGPGVRRCGVMLARWSGSMLEVGEQAQVERGDRGSRSASAGSQAEARIWWCCSSVAEEGALWIADGARGPGGRRRPRGATIGGSRREGKRSGAGGGEDEDVACRRRPRPACRGAPGRGGSRRRARASTTRVSTWRRGRAPKASSRPQRPTTCSTGALAELEADASLGLYRRSLEARTRRCADRGELAAAERVEHEGGLDAVPQLDGEGGAGGRRGRRVVAAGRRRGSRRRRRGWRS